MKRSSWVVHKFGGTSVANAARYKNAWEILKTDRGSRQGVVVSAMSGITDALLECVGLASKRDDSYGAKLDSIRAKHFETVEELLPTQATGPIQSILDKDIKNLSEILKGVWHARHADETAYELVSGHGEVWSAQLLNAYLSSQGVQSCWLDARQVLIVERGDRRVSIDWSNSQTNLDRWLSERNEDVVVITGFVASTSAGIATTLKRNGSDFSASIFGVLLKASEITIWTDVDGVLTADPRLVPDAVVVDELSYAEATELAYFGAKVVHPSTMGPAIKDKIPIWIRNSFKPHLAGSKIHGAPSPSGQPVRGFATINGIALFNVEGTGMVGVPGVAERLFGSLREVGVSVIMISQASSEHSISFAVGENQAAQAKAAVEKTFYAEIHLGQIQPIAFIGSCSILAIVGDNMVHRPGVAADFFAAMSRASVNIRAIAQGSSERNISVIVDSKGSVKALRAAHSAFYLSPQTISLGIIGCGRVGGAFIEQLKEGAARLKNDHRIDLRIRGLLNSSKMLLSDERLDLATWRESLEKKGSPPSLEIFLKHVRAEHLPHAAIIDLTASSDLSQLYPDWMRSGLHVITPNKKGNTGNFDLYKQIKATARSFNRHYLYETTCGAGLPILRTLRDLVRTGDAIHRIEGVLSGTLSFLFNRFTGDSPFSEIVKQAHALGYTEPDPRDDLSGMDVARKLVILARECNMTIEVADVTVQNLVPEPLRSGGVPDFFSRLAGQDASWLALVQAARAKHQCLRYVGTLDFSAGPGRGTASVALRSYPLDHPFARLGETDNIVAFSTARYQPQPLVVQGPGAGPEVTAAGVFADLLRLTSYLGGQG